MNNFYVDFKINKINQKCVLLFSSQATKNRSNEYDIINLKTNPEG